MSSNPGGYRFSPSPPAYANQHNIMHQQQQQQAAQQAAQQLQQALQQQQQQQRQSSPAPVASKMPPSMMLTKQQQQMQQQHQLQQQYQQHLQQQQHVLQQQHQQQQQQLAQLQQLHAQQQQQHHQQQQQQQQSHQQQQSQSQQSQQYGVNPPSLSGSETDISTSNENLSSEQRYVLRHTPRVEPQGQENLAETVASGTETPARFPSEQRFSSNTSTDSTRYPVSSNRSISESRQLLYGQPPTGSNPPQSGGVSAVIAAAAAAAASAGNASNRNSMKDTNSNRSSMDVSTCSYNTLIIHPDDQLYASSMNGSRDYTSPSELVMNTSTTSSSAGVVGSLKKDRPRSYGEQGMQEITEIPDDYLNQSHVLKHLAKEIKNPIQRRRSNARDSGVVSENTDTATNSATTTMMMMMTPPPQQQQQQQQHQQSLTPTMVMKDPPQYGQWIIEDQNEGNNKSKSKSQPDLTKLTEAEVDDLEAIAKENIVLKQQLHACFSKVSKTQKLEEEVANIYCVHEELKQTCERREKLERAARLRLQSDLNRVQELNRVMKDQMDILQSQLLAPSEHQLLIAQLFTQNKDLSAAKDRQEIELVAQRATLQEQRNHIGILDTALTNAQHNIRRLEEELRKKQMHLEKLSHMQQQQQQHQQQQQQQSQSHKGSKQRMDAYETELAKESNRSGSSTNSVDGKWQLHEKSSQMMRLESEQRQLEEQVMRQTAANMSTLDKNNQEDRIAEAKNDKIRYLEEVHSAQRKVTDLQTHLKVLESKLAEKDTEIRLLQEKKAVCGSSFDSYNSFGLNPLGYASQASFNASSQSFNTNNTTNTASSLLLDHHHHHNNNNNNNSSSNSNQLPHLHLHQQQQSQHQTYGSTAGNSNQTAATATLNLPSYATSSSGGGGSPFANGSSPYSDSSSAGGGDTSYDNLIVGGGGLAASGRQSSLADQMHMHHHHHHQQQQQQQQQQMLHQHSGSTATLSSGNQKQQQQQQLQQQHQLVDDQLMSKVSQMSLAQVTQLLEQKQRELSVTSRIIRDQIASSKEIVDASAAEQKTAKSQATTATDLRQDTEEFC